MIILYYDNKKKAASSISGGEVVFQLPADQHYIATLGVELAQGGMQNVSTPIFSKLSSISLDCIIIPQPHLMELAKERAVTRKLQVSSTEQMTFGSM